MNRLIDRLFNLIDIYTRTENTGPRQYRVLLRSFWISLALTAACSAGLWQLQVWRAEAKGSYFFSEIDVLAAPMVLLLAIGSVGSLFWLFDMAWALWKFRRD
jgi:hypothetical protein